MQRRGILSVLAVTMLAGVLFLALGTSRVQALVDDGVSTGEPVGLAVAEADSSNIDESENPDDPDNPDDQEDPDNPDDQEDPDNPNDPDDPDNPDDPDDPDNPDDPPAPSHYFDVVEDFGAVGDGVEDDTGPLKRALAESRDDEEMTTIFVPAGTYRISSYLFIYSNTTLTLDPDATIIADESFGDGTMLGAVHMHGDEACDGVRKDCTTGGYNQIFNVIVEGGTWDRNVKGSGQAAVMRFNHGHDITIRNTTLLHASDHFMNLSGTHDTLVQNVTFKDFVYTYIEKKFGTREYQNEAVHLDSMQSIGEAGAYPQDGTVTHDVLVEGCTFANIPDGVGNHHVNADLKKSHGITVRNCTFTELTGRAVNIYKTDGFVVEGCRATNCTAFAVAREETCTIRNNRVIGTKKHSKNTWDKEAFGIKVVDSRGAVVTNNVITGTYGPGIWVVRTVDPAVSRMTVTNNVSVSLQNTSTYYDITIGNNCIGTVKDNNLGVRGYKHFKGTKSNVTESGNGIKNQADKVRRLFGNGRYDTMEAIVRAGFSQKGGTVVVATGTGFKDALAAAGLAGLDGAPVVLTDGKTLSAKAKSELVRLAPSKVYVAGGKMAVSDDVLKQIRSATKVEPERLAGNTSASTSAELALQGNGQWQDNTAIIATNKSFKDALSVAPVSYAMHWPILLADNGKSLNKDVLNALQECEVTNVIIVGGTTAVTTNVESQLKGIGVTSIERWGDATGTKTSAYIARKAIALGMSPDRMGVATSQGFPDALAGAALCGKNNAVLVLADDKDKTNMSFPSAYRSSIETVYVFGGSYAVGNTTWCALVCAAA